jgi:predicted metal-dependent phosphoesterase TrpH
MLADALVRAGHAHDRQDAFLRYLARDRPAYVPRTGPPPHEVVAIVNEASGLASIAHPGVTRQDACIAPLAKAGLAAIEVYHSDHASRHRSRYARLARELGLAMTGGSDFHGQEAGRPRPLGAVSLPRKHYHALVQLAQRRGCADVPRRVLPV